MLECHRNPSELLLAEIKVKVEESNALLNSLEEGYMVDPNYEVLGDPIEAFHEDPNDQDLH